MWSVWNYDRQEYDYYEGGRPKGTHASSPPKTVGRSALGATPEQAAWKLPLGAKHVGSGSMPRGRIASSSAGVGMGDTDLGDVGKLAAIVGGAWLAWKVMK